MWKTEKAAEMAVSSHFSHFFFVIFCYKLEKYPYFPFTMWLIFGKTAHPLFCTLFSFVHSLKFLFKTYLNIVSLF